MRTFAHRPHIRRSPLRSRQKSVSPVDPSTAAVQASSRPGPAAPAKKWPRMETRRQAEERNEVRLKVLLPGLPEVGGALLKCDGADHPCSLPICAVCALAYRRGPIAQLHDLADAYEGPHEVATIYLGLFPPDSLGEAHLGRAHEMLRKRLDRAGFKGAIVVGGIEVAWQDGWQRWLLHAQVLAMGVDPKAWKRLEVALKKGGTAYPVDHVSLRNPDEQLSYCIKFVTYHRPGRRRVPLLPDRLVELAAWCAPHRFEDFLFAYGARRRGGRIVVDE
jgi:hypothetical protein